MTQVPGSTHLVEPPRLPNSVHTKLLQLYTTLCNPMDCGPPGSSVNGILQARIGSGLSCPPPGDRPNPGIEPVSLMSPRLAGRIFVVVVVVVVVVVCHWEAHAYVPMCVIFCRLQMERFFCTDFKWTPLWLRLQLLSHQP